MKKLIIASLFLVTCLCAQAADQDQLTLEAGQVQATFDLKHQGSIVSLRNGDIEVVTHPNRGALFEIGIEITG